MFAGGRRWGLFMELHGTLPRTTSVHTNYSNDLNPKMKTKGGVLLWNLQHLQHAGDSPPNCIDILAIYIYRYLKVTSKWIQLLELQLIVSPEGLGLIVRTVYELLCEVFW